MKREGADEGADEETGEGDGHGEGDAEDGFEQVQAILSWLWVLLFVITICLMVYYGPSAVLAEVFKVMPRKPGWDWYIGLCALTCIAIICLTPLWPPLCMFAGMVFGFQWGWLHNFVAVYFAACASFAIGRYFLKDRVRGWLSSGDSKRTKIMLAVLEDEDDSMKFMCLFRFLFMPMFLKNYGPSTLEIPLWKLCVAAIPHSLWISFLFASLGATFQNTAELIRNGEEGDLQSMKWQQLAVFCVACLVTVLLSACAYGRYSEKAESFEAQSIAEAPPVPASASSS